MLVTTLRLAVCAVTWCFLCRCGCRRRRCRRCRASLRRGLPRAGVGGPEAEIGVGGEREGAAGEQREEPVGEALTGAYGVEDSLCASGD